MLFFFTNMVVTVNSDYNRKDAFQLWIEAFIEIHVQIVHSADSRRSNGPFFNGQIEIVGIWIIHRFSLHDIQIVKNKRIILSHSVSWNLNARNSAEQTLIRNHTNYLVACACTFRVLLLYFMCFMNFTKNNRERDCLSVCFVRSISVALVKMAEPKMNINYLHYEVSRHHDKTARMASPDQRISISRHK